MSLGWTPSDHFDIFHCNTCSYKFNTVIFMFICDVHLISFNLIYYMTMFELYLKNNNFHIAGFDPHQPY